MAYIIHVGISLKPWYGNMLGGVPIVVSGPSFYSYDSYSLMFDTVIGDCNIINATSILCVSPTLTETGRIEVQLYINSMPHYLPMAYCNPVRLETIQFTVYHYHLIIIHENIADSNKINIVAGKTLQGWRTN